MWEKYVQIFLDQINCKRREIWIFYDKTKGVDKVNEKNIYAF